MIALQMILIKLKNDDDNCYNKDNDNCNKNILIGRRIVFASWVLRLLLLNVLLASYSSSSLLFLLLLDFKYKPFVVLPVCFDFEKLKIFAQYAKCGQ